MREPGDGGRRRRDRSSRRLLPFAIAGIALVAAGVVTKLGVGGVTLVSPSNAVTQPQPSQATAASSTMPSAATTGRSGRSGSDNSGGTQVARARSGSGGGEVVQPPTGSQVQDVLRSTGVLTYRCRAGTYRLAGTSMKLFVQNGGFAGTQTELLAWRFKNGTTVDAALVTQVRSQKALSQALFRVVKVHGGNANDRATTYIVRLPDSGGLPPAGCATSGKRITVPFTTRYVFYRSATAHG
jgi:hypothetical protein